MRYGYRVLLLFALLICSLSACSKAEDREEGEGIDLYYLDESGTKLKTVTCMLQGGSTEEKIEELISAMSEDREGCISALPTEIEVLSYQVSNDILSLNLNAAYDSLDGVTEIFARAAMVLTLTGLEEIDCVSFYVEGNPLKDALGNTVGMLKASNITDKVGNTLNNYESATVTLYFANIKGNSLRTEVRTGMYDSSRSLERYIVEQLIAGPSADGDYKTLPQNTEILSINTNNGVCYVDFSEEFVQSASSVKDEVMIYSIVNSLTELSHINRVQISVEGKTDIELHGRLSLNTSFVKNLSYMEQ